MPRTAPPRGASFPRSQISCASEAGQEAHARISAQRYGRGSSEGAQR